MGGRGAGSATFTEGPLRGTEQSLCRTLPRHTPWFPALSGCVRLSVRQTETQGPQATVGPDSCSGTWFMEGRKSADWALTPGSHCQCGGC